MLRVSVGIAIGAVCVSSCVSTSEKSSPTNAKAKHKTTTEEVTRTQVPEPESVASGAEQEHSSELSKACQGDLYFEIPIFLIEPKSMAMVITRVTKTCKMKGGRYGVAADSDWMGMGIPCAGGGGRTQWKGTTSANPKLIMFHLRNDCQMLPQDQDALERLVRAKLRLSEQSRALAYVPLAIQLWEAPQFEEWGLGDSIEMRSPAALGKGWTGFREGQPIEVRLYGRENAWVQNTALYQVDAEIIFTALRAFRLNVRRISIVNDDGKEELLKRCETQPQLRNACRELLSNP